MLVWCFSPSLLLLEEALLEEPAKWPNDTTPIGERLSLKAWSCYDLRAASATMDNPCRQ